jgi:N-methylhydantoinase A
MRLDPGAARRAIERKIARPMRLSVEQAAAGIYRVACNNMAQGVREVTIKRGYDPREFAFIAAGGAGPMHSCLICSELDIPVQIVPACASVMCAYGMLLCELQHDFVRTFIARVQSLDWERLAGALGDMRREGEHLLDQEQVPKERRRYRVRLDCRYTKQYHEVSFEVSDQAIEDRDCAAIERSFHAEHDRLYGYSLEGEPIPIEIINLRLQAIGATQPARYPVEHRRGADASAARKNARPAYVLETASFESIDVYDGHRLRCGNMIEGPAIIETATTTVLVSESFDCVIDGYRSFVLYRKGRDDLVRSCFEPRAELVAP